MGFFSELKEMVQTGGEFVTKTVTAANTEVGRKKIQMIETMQKEGYILVNEVAEHGYIDGFLGVVAATTYTLTFRRKPEPEKTLKKYRRKIA